MELIADIENAVRNHDATTARQLAAGLTSIFETAGPIDDGTAKRADLI